MRLRRSSFRHNPNADHKHRHHTHRRNKLQSQLNSTAKQATFTSTITSLGRHPLKRMTYRKKGGKTETGICTAVNYLATELPKTNKKQVALIIDVGTFCDYRLMNTAVSKLRKYYQLVYITDKSHRLPPDDIRVTYEFPSDIIDHASDITTAFTSGSYSEMMFVIMHPNITKQSLVSLFHVTAILNQTIQKYHPARVLAHSGNLQHVVASRCYLHIPTTVIYFSPGMLPNRSVPFVFHNVLKQRSLRIHDTDNRDNSEHIGMAYQQKIESSAKLFSWWSKLIPQDKQSWIESYVTQTSTLERPEGTFKHLEKIHHIMCFDTPLVPHISYSVPNMHVYNVGLLPPQLSSEPLDGDLKRWITAVKKKKCARKPVPIVFVSFGSFGKPLMDAIPNFVMELDRACELLDMYAIFHDDVTKCTAYKHITTTRIRFHTSFVPYPSVVKQCDLVCFTGSVCLQNVCWAHARRMLYVPYLSEQFYWAKLYKMHTGIDYIDYMDPNSHNSFAERISRALQVHTDIHERIKGTISEKRVTRAIAEVVRTGRV